MAVLLELLLTGDYGMDETGPLAEITDEILLGVQLFLELTNEQCDVVNGSIAISIEVNGELIFGE